MDLQALGAFLSDYGFPVVVAGYLIYSIQPQLRALQESVTNLTAVVQQHAVTQQQLIMLIREQNDNTLKVAQALVKINTKLDIPTE